jgi:tetratricopeptide repeat protein
LLIRTFARIYPLLALAAVLIPAFRAVILEAQTQQGISDNYSGISVEPSQQVFATMCALDAAGFGQEASTLAEMPERLALRGDMLKMQGPATERLRSFYHEHALADPGETLARYMALALAVGPPPRFQFQMDRDSLPPDVLAIEGFQEVLADFYKESQLDTRWSRIAPEYEAALARYQEPVRRIVTVSNAYLRELLKPSQGRTFTVYVEPLVGNRTTFRNSGDHYAIVVGGGAQVPVDDIRHAYLHFKLDPLPLRARSIVQTKSALLGIAARAPRLPVEYQSDFLAFTDECLIKAVELRLRRPAPQVLEAALNDDDQSGFILVRTLVQQLQKFEKAEPAMSYYFPDLIAGIDVPSEQKRLKGVTFAAAAELPATSQTTASASGQGSELDRWLAEGDHEIALQDAPEAAAIFEKILGKYPNQPRALYGLAIASVLSGDAARAKDLFEKLISGSVESANREPGGTADTAILAWSHVYLGRMHDLLGDRDLAIGEYRAALTLDGAPESARVAAQRGIDVAYQAPARAKDNGGQGP